MKPPPPLLTLALAGASIVIHLVPGLTEALQFDRAALARGEWWRGATGHLTHFDLNHLLWDTGMLVALGWLCERESRARMLAAIVTAAAVIPAALWLWQPQFGFYRGLSGIDSALFGMFAFALVQRDDSAARGAGGAALALIAAKCVFEATTATTVFVEGKGYAPVPLAHALGALCGVMAAAAPAWLSRRTCRRAAAAATPPPSRPGRSDPARA